MHRAGTKIIRCMSYPNADPPWAKSDWKAEVVRRLRELARIAADGGVILAHENCSGYGGEGPDEVLELLDAVSNDAFQIIFDTGNQPHGGKSGLYEYYEKVKDHVVHVHVKATKLADGKRQICFADEDSDGTPRRVFQDLKKRRYDGWVSIEPHLAAQVHLGTTPGDTRTATDLYVEYGRRLMKLIDAIP
jgi:sugar phosphate isomerase/epimerase